MKALFVILTLVTSVYANQVGTRLEEGDTYLNTISEVRHLSQRLMCPDNTCVINGTVVSVELPLGGCLDRLGPVTYTAEQVGNTIVINMTAIRIANKKSLAAFCVKEPTQIVEISLIDMYGHVELDLLQSVQ